MIVFPHAKINLGLNVLEKRQDGFHNIESIFYPVNLCDILEIIELKKESDSEIVMSVSGLKTDCIIEDNLVYKAALRVKEQFNTPRIKIHLHKIIPAGAGLGGGSSDAAFTIKLLNSLFQLNIKNEEMKMIAGELGSDCPYFIEGGVQLVSGTGNIMNEVNVDLKGLFLVLIKTDLHVNTKNAYSKITPSIPAIKIRQIANSEIENWNLKLINDFEKVIFDNHKSLYELKTELTDKGAIYASMTGSGSAVYGIFKNKPIDLNAKNRFIYTAKL